MAAGELIGKPLKVDATTLNRRRGNFARICVEIDLGKPLIPVIDLNGCDQPVTYEGLHLICFSYGRSGHRKDTCPYTTTLASDRLPTATAEMTVGASLPIPPVPQVDLNCAAPPPFGPWMLPTRRNHWRPTGKTKNGGLTAESRNPPSGSRYDVLAAVEDGTSNGLVLEGVALPSGGGRTDIPPTMAPDRGGVALHRSPSLSLQQHTSSARRATRKHPTPPALGSVRLSHARGQDPGRDLGSMPTALPSLPPPASQSQLPPLASLHA
ncbi:hypothetical protein K2173_024825 [Erythroxylum novogranatense]|uniref:Uncharacterized protein n=1 Tax=Erythroxylum novogranatense TaxID=1862640 RepID=A0AAV8UCM0_9ROSI|nr:hypothetical protein K2173_024825 [Erythroxylum novogranatense]